MEARRVPIAPPDMPPGAARRSAHPPSIDRRATRDPRWPPPSAPRRLRRAIAAWAAALSLTPFLTGCAVAPPTPFSVGEIVAAPAGCQKAKERGHDC